MFLMKTLIESIVKPLVDHPDNVSVSSEESDEKVMYTLRVHGEDMGKVIGKQGRVAKAIRSVVYAAGSGQQKRVFLEISD